MAMEKMLNECGNESHRGEREYSLDARMPMVLAGERMIGVPIVLLEEGEICEI